MTRPAVTRNLERTIDWCGDARKAADQWMDNFFECRLDLINEAFAAEMWRAFAILGWVCAAACFGLYLAVKP